MLSFNFRRELHKLPDAELARRLEATIYELERLHPLGAGKDWSWPLSFSRLSRSAIRHPWGLKAGLLLCLIAGPQAVFFVPAWLAAGGKQRQRALRPLRAYLLKCEVQDLMDEVERRVAKRKGRS
jgi:hypothetical protein